MVERISAKHASVEVRAEQYDTVGNYLLGAVANVPGEAATPEIVEAWAAYNQLATTRRGRKREICEEAAGQPHGWRKFKPWRVERKVRESEAITSFYLIPADGEPVVPFRAGHYLSLKVRPPGYPFDQIRQYSVPCAPDDRVYRISVKREGAPQDVPDADPGLVSHFLHDQVQQGDLIAVHVPLEDFVVEGGDSPVVLLSGGAGITAVLAMLEWLANLQGGSRMVLFVHATRDRAHHAFGEPVCALARQRPGIRVLVLHEEAGAEDIEGTHRDAVGRVTAEVLCRHLPERAAEFHYCEPLGVVAATEGALDQFDVPPHSSLAEHRMRNFRCSDTPTQTWSARQRTDRRAAGPADQCAGEW